LKKTDLTMILPAKDENIALMMEETQRAFNKAVISGEIIVVDDRSIDGTFKAAKNAAVKNTARGKRRFHRRGHGYLFICDPIAHEDSLGLWH